MGLTDAGMILGTAAYMSPEQARGSPVDKRADIWAFGVVLHEMLTGQRLFHGESVSDILAAVIKDQPDFSRIPSRVRPLLKLCLEKDPKLRLRAIGAIDLLLEKKSRGFEPHRWLWPSVSAAAAIAALLVGFVHFREQPPVAETVRFQIPAPDKAPFVPSIPAISPDGRRLVFQAAAGGASQLWVRSLDTLEARPLSGTEGNINVNALFWSPDSRFVAFQQPGGTLRKADASGGPPQAVSNVSSTIRGGAWSRDGVIVVGTNTSGLLRIPEASGAAAPLTRLDSSRGEGYHGYPSFLPDGRRFIYFRAGGGAETRGIYLGSLDLPPERQSSKRLLAAAGMAVYAPSSDPDRGHILFLREGSLMAQPFDARKAELAGEAFPVAEGVGSGNGGIGFYSSSMNGVLAFRTGAGTAGATTQLTWFDRTGKSLGAVGEPSDYNAVSLSPDGTRAAVMRSDSQRGGQGNLDVWVHDLARNIPTRLTVDPANDAWPVWSPDGSRVAFSSDREGVYNLYRKDASGAGSDELLFKSGEAKFVQDWSRDGRFLIYSHVGGGGMDLSVLPLDGGAPKAPIPYLKTEFFESQGRFSPDGRFVAYNSNQSGRNEIYVQPFPDPSKGKWQVSRGGGTAPRWRRDGKELFYISADSKMMAAEVSLTPTFSARVPKALFTVPILGGGAPVNTTRYDVTADGQKFLITSLTTESTGAPSPPFTVVLNWQAGLKK
jgi:Tol biopolymer transport system component